MHICNLPTLHSGSVLGCEVVFQYCTLAAYFAPGMERALTAGEDDFSSPPHSRAFPFVLSTVVQCSGHRGTRITHLIKASDRTAALTHYADRRFQEKVEDGAIILQGKRD